MKMAAGPGKDLVEFGLRRAQGPDGAMMATQFSYLGGFDGILILVTKNYIFLASSNVLGGFTFGIDIKGTMAHAFIMSYNSLDEIKVE